MHHILTYCEVLYVKLKKKSVFERQKDTATSLSSPFTQSNTHTYRFYLLTYSPNLRVAGTGPGQSQGMRTQFRVSSVGGKDPGT